METVQNKIVFGRKTSVEKTKKKEKMRNFFIHSLSMQINQWANEQQKYHFICLHNEYFTYCTVTQSGPGLLCCLFSLLLLLLQQLSIATSNVEEECQTENGTRNGNTNNNNRKNMEEKLMLTKWKSFVLSFVCVSIWLLFVRSFSPASE